jgi:hypothetical protein
LRAGRNRCELRHKRSSCGQHQQIRTLLSHRFGDVISRRARSFARLFYFLGRGVRLTA